MIAGHDSEPAGGRLERRLREIQIAGSLRNWERECLEIQASLSGIRRRIQAQLENFDRLLPDAVANPVGVITDLCAGEWGVSYDAILARGRTARVVVPRQVAMALAYDLTRLSTTAVGRAFRRDHGTVIYARRAVADQASIDPVFRRRLDRVRSLAQAAIRTPQSHATTS